MRSGDFYMHSPAGRELQDTARTAQLAQIQLGCAKTLPKGLFHILDAIQLTTPETVLKPFTVTLLLQVWWYPDTDILRLWVRISHDNPLLVCLPVFTVSAYAVEDLIPTTD
jgi:hypothetical protein